MRPQVDRAYGEMSTFKNVSIITTLCLGINVREGELRTSVMAIESKRRGKETSLARAKTGQKMRVENNRGADP